MVRDIVMFGDPLLREKCGEVTEFDDELRRLLDDMHETMKQADGIGLAAPQVGVLKRVVVIDISEDYSERIELINPVITTARGRQFEEEGCLSCKGRRGIVRRPKRVRLTAYDRFGRLRKFYGKELLARAFCHEIDHLDGILFEDKVLEWVEAEDDE